MTPLLVDLPIKTSNPLNSAGWSRPMGAQRAAAAAHQQQKRDAFHIVSASLARRGIRGVDLSLVVVTLTRVGRLDRHDGLAASCKWLADGIAAALGLDDADPRIQWRYDQRPPKRGDFGVQVLIEPFERKE